MGKLEDQRVHGGDLEEQGPRGTIHLVGLGCDKQACADKAVGVVA